MRSQSAMNFHVTIGHRSQPHYTHHTFNPAQHIIDFKFTKHNLGYNKFEVHK